MYMHNCAAGKALKRMVIQDRVTANSHQLSSSFDSALFEHVLPKMVQKAYQSVKKIPRGSIPPPDRLRDGQHASDARAHLFSKNNFEQKTH